MQACPSAATKARGVKYPDGGMLVFTGPRAQVTTMTRITFAVLLGSTVGSCTILASPRLTG